MYLHVSRRRGLSGPPVGDDPASIPCLEGAGPLIWPDQVYCSDVHFPEYQAPPDAPAKAAANYQQYLVPVGLAALAVLVLQAVRGR